MLRDNPVHEENSWIARAGCDFMVNAVLDAQRQLLAVVGGDMEKAFCEGAGLVSRLVTDTLDAPADIVVTSSAGYPLDTTFYQSVKGMVAAMETVRPGGTIILAASMSEGIGRSRVPADLRGIPDSGTLYGADSRWSLSNPGPVAGRRTGQGPPQGEGRGRQRRVATGGDRVAVRRVPPSVEAAVAECLVRYGPRASIAAIPKGPYVIAELAAPVEGVRT